MELKIEIPQAEYYDPDNAIFITRESKSFTFLHSLKNVSKWEMEYQKSFFLEDSLKDVDARIRYYEIMSGDEFDYGYFSSEIDTKIIGYITDKMSATILPQSTDSNNKITYTSELIYAYMFLNQIPMEVENWHLSRLFVLLGTISELNKQASGDNKTKPANINDVIALNQQRLERGY